MANVNDETGVEFLRRAVRCLDWSNDDALEGLSPEQVLQVVRAVWGSKWDMFPDQLTREEIAHAAKTGKLSDDAEARLDRDLR